MPALIQPPGFPWHMAFQKLEKALALIIHFTLYDIKPGCLFIRDFLWVKAIGGKSGATRLHCSQKFFEDLGFGRKFLWQKPLGLSLVVSPVFSNHYLADTFCLSKIVQAKFLFE